MPAKTTSAKKPLSWKPVRKGLQYCSPACGHGCKLHEFKRATREADRLAKSMGAGWQPEVWENLGWHYSTNSKCGRLAVHANRDLGKGNQYSAYLRHKGSGGGNFVGLGSTPQAAVRDAVSQASAQIDKLKKLIKGLA